MTYVKGVGRRKVVKITTSQCSADWKKDHDGMYDGDVMNGAHFVVMWSTTRQGTKNCSMDKKVVEGAK